MSRHLSGFSRFLVVWFGQLVSAIGSGLTGFALAVYVFQLTGSAAHYSLVLLAAFLPSLLLKPIGGAIVDRYDRRLMMIIGDAGSIAGVAFIIVMMLLGVKSLWPIYLGSIISSVFVALQNPAYKASVTDLLDESHYSKGSGLMQLSESSRYVLSPMIAGMLMSWFNLESVLLVDCATFVVAIVTVFWIKSAVTKKANEQPAASFREDLVDGFRYTVQHRPLMVLLCVISFVTFFVGLLQALLGPMVLVNHSAKAFGFSLSIAATGMLLTSLLIGLFSKTTRKVPILSVGLLLSGIFYALIGVSPSIMIITAFTFCFFLCLPFVNTSLDVLVRRNVDHQMQGRVWSIVSLISQMGMLIAFAIAGFMADHLFNPLLLKQGALSHSVGALIGVGPGRGIGLIFILSGLLNAVIAMVIARLKSLKTLDLPSSTAA